MRWVTPSRNETCSVLFLLLRSLTHRPRVCLLQVERQKLKTEESSMRLSAQKGRLDLSLNTAEQELQDAQRQIALLQVQRHTLSQQYLSSSLRRSPLHPAPPTSDSAQIWVVIGSVFRTHVNHP